MLLKVQNACRTNRNVDFNGTFTDKVTSVQETNTALLTEMDGSNVWTTGLGNMITVVVKNTTSRFIPPSVSIRLRCVLLRPVVVTEWETPGNTVADIDMVTSEQGRTNSAHVPRQAVPFVMSNRSVFASLRVCRGVDAVTWARTTL